VNIKLVIAALTAAVAGIAACSSARAGGTPHGDHPEWNRLTLTVDQQASGIVSLAKQSGACDNTSYTVKWALFPYGPPLIAAASSGQIDLGDVGNVPYHRRRQAPRLQDRRRRGAGRPQDPVGRRAAHPQDLEHHHLARPAREEDRRAHRQLSPRLPAQRHPKRRPHP
jgi:ABC-type nitrate/sulfonate/bicarbonate transport system substrate-binding protein